LLRNSELKEIKAASRAEVVKALLFRFPAGIPCKDRPNLYDTSLHSFCLKVKKFLPSPRLAAQRPLFDGAPCGHSAWQGRLSKGGTMCTNADRQRIPWPSFFAGGELGITKRCALCHRRW